MTRSFLSRLEKLEARYPVGNLQSMSDAELIRAMFSCLEGMVETGANLDYDDDAIKLAESFLVNRERGRNFREYHVDEWNTLNEICDRIEKICKERGFPAFISDLRERLDSLSFEDFDKRFNEVIQSLARGKDHFVSRDVFRYGRG